MVTLTSLVVTTGRGTGEKHPSAMGTQTATSIETEKRMYTRR
jgi:hypothetical protein